MSSKKFSYTLNTLRSFGRSSKRNANSAPSSRETPPPIYTELSSALDSKAPMSPTSPQRATSFPLNTQSTLSPNSPQYAPGEVPPGVPYADAACTPGPQVSTPWPPQPHVPLSIDPRMRPVTRHKSFRDNGGVKADPYEGLSRVDTAFVIDDSGSMSGSNWAQTSAALSAIVPICTEHDSDGVDIYFLNHPNAHTNICESSQVLSIFSAVRPTGTTPTGKKLGELFALYLKSYKQNRNIKPLNIIVITDGEPTDPDTLERNIVNTARELDRLGAAERQIGVQFFQVGSDEGATESLEELDNSLVEQWGVRDMVDTVSWKKMNEGRGLSADGILKAVLGAVDKSLDRRRKL